MQRHRRRVRKKTQAQQQDQEHDGYLYMEMTLEDTQHHKMNIQYFQEHSIPMEFSFSPSKCVCYRVREKDVPPQFRIPLSSIPKEERHLFGCVAVPFFVKNKQQTTFRMFKKCISHYLFSEWERIPVKKRIRRKRK